MFEVHRKSVHDQCLGDFHKHSCNKLTYTPLQKWQCAFYTNNPAIFPDSKPLVNLRFYAWKTNNKHKNICMKSNTNIQ